MLESVIFGSHQPAIRLVTSGDVEYAHKLLEPIGTARAVLVAADPGMGKTWATQEYLVDEFVAGRLRRVLWFSPSTLHDHSLGQETLEKLTEKLDSKSAIGVNMIKGSAHFASPTRRGDYEAQFEWSLPGIKILPHAYLSLLFSVHSAALSALFRELIEDVDLIVIDENPWSALVKSASFKLPVAEHPDLHQQLKTTLENLENRVPGNEPWRSDGIFGNRAVLPDGSAWDALGNTHSAFDPRTLLRSSQQSTNDDTQVIAALKSSQIAYHSGKRRYDVQLVAEHTEYTDSLEVTLHGSSHSRLPFLPRTIILDAYGTRDTYQLIFADLEVAEYNIRTGLKPRIIHLGIISSRLSKYGIDLSLIKGEGETFFRRLGWQIACLLDPRRPATLAAYKKHLEVLRPYIEKAFAALYPGQILTAEMLLDLSFFGTRGQNSFAERDLIMLMSPESNGTSDLLEAGCILPDPEQASERKLWLNKRRVEEYLQTVNRARQPNHPGVRIFQLGFPSEALELSQIADVTSRSVEVYRKNSKDLMWDVFADWVLSATRSLLAELLHHRLITEIESRIIPLGVLTLTGLTKDRKRQGQNFLNWITTKLANLPQPHNSEIVELLLRGTRPKRFPDDLFSSQKNAVSGGNLEPLAEHWKNEFGFQRLNQVLTVGTVDLRSARSHLKKMNGT